MSGTESERDRLRQRIADAGVAVFRNARVAQHRAPDTDAATLAALLRDLVTCDDPRLVSAIPCLIMHAAHAGPALASAASSLDGASRRRLGVVHRVARALAISREPDLRQTTPGKPFPGCFSRVLQDLGESRRGKACRAQGVSRKAIV